MDKLKKYDKYYVKRNPATLDLLVEKGKPVLGEVGKKGCPLEEKHVKILNKGWETSGIYYAESKNEVEQKAEKKAGRPAKNQE